MNSLKKSIYSAIIISITMAATTVYSQSFSRTDNNSGDYSDFYVEETDESSTVTEVNQYTYDSEQNNSQQNTSFTDDPREKAYQERENAQQPKQNQAYSNNAVSQNTYDFTGQCSWYGRKYQGRPTASGEKFDMYAYTAAHKTLPFGTVLLVTNLENGKSIKVRINDRGPYVKPRILDLSYAAARDIDMLKKGEVTVGVKIFKTGDGSAVEPNTQNNVTPVSARYTHAQKLENDEYASDAAPSQVPTGRFKLQVGAFYSRANAEKLKAKLESMFNNPVEIIHENDMYKVRIINIQDKYEAERYRKILAQQNLPGYIVKD